MNTDLLLAQKLKEGDESVFQSIFDKHFNLLCNFAYTFVEDRQMAEEIVDDAIFYLWEHREEIEFTYSIRSYLMRSVRNGCLNELNSLHHRKEVCLSHYLSEDSVDFLENVFLDDSHPLGVLIEQELEHELYRLIDSLPNECRLVFRKSRFEDKTYEEIAQDLGISVNTVKYHIKKALAYLHENLQKFMVGWLLFFLTE